MRLNFLSIFLMILLFLSCQKKEVKVDHSSTNLLNIEFTYDTLVVYSSLYKVNYMKTNGQICDCYVNVTSMPTWITTDFPDFYLGQIKPIEFRHTIPPAPVLSVAYGQVVYQTPVGPRSFTVKALY